MAEREHFSYHALVLKDKIMKTIKIVLIMLWAISSLSAQTIQKGYTDRIVNVTDSLSNLLFVPQESAVMYHSSLPIYLNYLQYADAANEDLIPPVGQMLLAEDELGNPRIIIGPIVQARSTNLNNNLHYKWPGFIPYDENSIISENRLFSKLQYGKMKAMGQKTNEGKGAFIGAVTGGLIGYFVGEKDSDSGLSLTGKPVLTIFGTLTGAMLGGAIGMKYPIKHKEMALIR